MSDKPYDPLGPIRAYCAMFKGMSSEERKITQAIFQREENAINPNVLGDGYLLSKDIARQKRLAEANRVLTEAGLL